MIKKLQRTIKNISLFDISLVIIGAIGLLTVGILLFRKTTDVTVTVKVTNSNVLYTSDNPPYWYAIALRKGETENDSVGRKQVKILNVQYYPTSSTDKIVFLKLLVNSVYSKSKNQYSYKGKPLLVGSSMRVEFENHLVDGIITEVGGQPSPFHEKTIQVKAKLQNLDPVYRETEGVAQYISDAIQIGDTMKDSNGEAVLTVTDKNSVPADRYVFGNDSMQIFPDPKKKDVYLILTLKVQEINNESYFLQTFPVKVGSYIPLNTPNIVSLPIITELVK